MNYPIVIHKDPDSDYGVTVPDLPGCFSAGSTLDEAMVMAREAIELHIEALLEDGSPVPPSSDVDVVRGQAEDPDDAIFAIVSIDLGKLPMKAQRINITMPERVLAMVDRFAERAGETRSGLLVKAVTDYMGRPTGPAHPAGRKPDRATPGKRKRRR